MVANVMKDNTTVIKNQFDYFSVDVEAEEFSEIWPKFEDPMMMKTEAKQKFKGRFQVKSVMTQDGWKEIEKQKRKKKEVQVHEKEFDIRGVICGEGTDVTVDSAAEESVCPQDWANNFEMQPLMGEGMKFVNANGGRIKHYGSKKVAIQVEGNETSRMMGFGFEVTDVKKPLLAVFRICEKGNVVQFGPQAHDNFIKNVQTNEKVFMKRKGNSYVIEGKLANESPFQRRGP